MATEAGTSTTPEGTDTDPKDQQQQSQQAAPDTGDQSQQTAPVVDKTTQLPSDHPLIVNHEKLKGELAASKTELAEARAQAAAATKLQQELDKRPTQEAVDTLQTRYDRLEAFLQSAGGPLGRALDSRTFTRDLFETDKDIATIVKDWNKANPSATSQALGAAAAAPADKKVDPNALIRAAAGR